MTFPALLAVDGDPRALGDVERELRARYSGSYEVICTSSPQEALSILTGMSRAEQEVALVLAGQWLSDTTGDELLELAGRLHPHAKRALLVDWGEWGRRPMAKAIFDSMALGRMDYFVLRPAVSPDELFHQSITSFLLEWTEGRRIAPQTVRIVAETWAGRGHELRAALERCAIPHAFHLSDSEEGRAVLDRAGPQAGLPLIVLPDGEVLVNPSNGEIADATGAAVEDPERHDFDLIIVGAGPAGLSAAVYGASEGLDTLVVDEGGIGGQATSSSLIRNYLGFPRGISGRRLAQQAYEQAWVFGADFTFMHEATGLRRVGDRLKLTLSDNRVLSARAIVLAMGASYRRLGVPELEALNGAGVFYGAPASEAPTMDGKDAYIVGGANSAGQAALHLASFARRVTLIVRAESLSAGMSHYLIQELEATPNVEVRLGAEPIGGGGDGRLEYLEIRDNRSGETETVPAAGLFILIGAHPRTEWLPDEIATDGQGFLLTGPDLNTRHGWPLERDPGLLETSMLGVFASGDVRHGSIKRVASAVGEGSIAIQLIHGLRAADEPVGLHRAGEAAL
ncbi:MAG TPA: FAD-dependent oxidoreductase [Solirubrobacterales bacterium]|nr:FAD-dependent oxidoreductase [Solirubrobacterales bacterium]